MSEGRMQRRPYLRFAVATFVVAVASCGPESSPESEVGPSWTIVEGTAETGSGVGSEATAPGPVPLAQGAIPLGRFVCTWEAGDASASLGYRFGEGVWERLVREQVTASGTWTLESSMAETRVLRLSQESGQVTRVALVGVTADSFRLEGAEALVYVRVEDPSSLPSAAVADGSGTVAGPDDAASAAMVEGSTPPVSAEQGSGLAPPSEAPSLSAGTGSSIRLDLTPTPAVEVSP